MTSYTITSDSELMRNYIQSDVLDPQEKFLALQTSTGGSLLFSRGTDKVFYVTQEVPGDRHGWRRSDLAEALIKSAFPGGAVFKDFAAAQCASGSEAGAIQLAMVVTAGGTDHLFLSLGNSASDTAWTDAPRWLACPFNAVNAAGDPVVAPLRLTIVNVFISEATDKEFIVVDVTRDATSGANPAAASDPVTLITRYFIDVTDLDHPAWRLHDLPFDLEAYTSSTCLGRRAPANNIEKRYPVDGTYVCGTVSGAAQFGYVPLYNPFDPSAPLEVAPLHLTAHGSLAPDAIAACRRPDNTSDLYAAAGGSLYCFASDNQLPGAVAVKVLDSAVFTGVRDLFAAVTDGGVTVWGRNASNEIFYTTCRSSSPVADAWTHPIPLLSGVEQVSPYLNRAQNAHTFFAHTGENKLTKAVKSPKTTLWSRREITLAPANTKAPARSFDSYTTRVQVKTPDQQPAANVRTLVSSSSLTSVYVNHLYYVIGPTPIEVQTDSFGSLTIVEAVHTVSGSRLTVTVDDATHDINPMDKPFKKAAGLDTRPLLRGATIEEQGGGTRPLVPATTSDDVLDQVGSKNKDMATAYHSLATRLAGEGGSISVVMPTSSTSILVEIGDFLSWLWDKIERGIECVVDLAKDALSGLWHFVTTIAGKVFYAVLDCVEAVVGAVQWLFNVLKTAAEDLFEFLEFLFDVDDMRRVKEVTANFTMLYLRHQVDQLKALRGAFDQNIEAAIKAIDGWAGVDWSLLGPPAHAAINSTGAPYSQQGVAGTLLAHHCQGNAAGGHFTTPAPTVEPDLNPINIFIDALTKEADAIGSALDKLHALAASFATMPLGEALKQLLAIVADLGLETIQNVIDTLFDVLLLMAEAALAAVTTPIYIPVVSDILLVFGVPEFSLLDLACWVVAIPSTIACKIACQRAPFADDATTKLLKTTTDYQLALATFRTLCNPTSASAEQVGADDGVQTHIWLHLLSGFCNVGSAICCSIDVALEGTSVLAARLALASYVLGVIFDSVADAVAFDEASATDEEKACFDLAMTINGLRVTCKCVFLSFNPDHFKLKPPEFSKNWRPKGWRGISGVVDAVFAALGICVSIWSFVLIMEKRDRRKVPILIMEETSHLTNNIARIAYALAIFTPPSPELLAIVIAMAFGYLATFGLQEAEAFAILSLPR